MVNNRRSRQRKGNMTNFNEILTEAGISPEIAAQAEAMFDTKLEEAIVFGVEQRLEESKTAWTIQQAEEIEKFLESVVSKWCETNAEALDNEIRSDVLTESAEKLRAFLGLSDKVINESVANANASFNQARDNQIETLSAQVTKLNDQLVENAAVIQEYRRADLFVDLTEGLSTHACDKITEALAESKFETDADFIASVKLLAESHKTAANPGKTTSTPADVNTGANPAHVTSLVEATLKQMRGQKL